MKAALPNLLTVARLVAVPVIVILMIAQTDTTRWWALAVFVVAAGTDYLDGYLARRWNVISTVGKLADPIADKALVLTTLLMLVILDSVPWWPLAVLAVREVAITVGRLSVAKDVVIAASPGGKLKTMLQLAAITLYLIPHSPLWVDTVALVLLIAAVIVAVVTGIDYGKRIASAAKEATRRGRTH